MSDYLIRGTAADLQVRAFAVDITETVEEARERHGTSPVITAALGRLLGACAMMSSTMKGEKDILTIMVKSDGPAQGLTVTGNSHGEIKGYPLVSQVDIPLKAPGKLDVGAALGPGTLTVVMDLGLKEPYSGQIELQTGEIGDDIAYYYTVSEQTPSAVGLGVMVDTDCSVKHAGGFMIQLMPDASEETISKLEERIAAMPQVTSLMEEGKGPEGFLEFLLGDMGLEITDKEQVAFKCNCSHDRMLQALATLKKSDLEEMVSENEPLEVVCHFCNSKYTIGVDELKEMISKNF